MPTTERDHLLVVERYEMITRVPGNLSLDFSGFLIDGEPHPLASSEARTL